MCVLYKPGDFSVPVLPQDSFGGGLIGLPSDGLCKTAAIRLLPYKNKKWQRSSLKELIVHSQQNVRWPLLQEQAQMLRNTFEFFKCTNVTSLQVHTFRSNEISIILVLSALAICYCFSKCFNLFNLFNFQFTISNSTVSSFECFLNQNFSWSTSLQVASNHFSRMCAFGLDGMVVNLFCEIEKISVLKLFESTQKFFQWKKA